VPHIFAPGPVELAYAYGWSQAHGHADRLLRLYGESRGRGAEYWGEGALELDRYVHTMGIPERARSWYAAQREPFRDMLDAFARGINDYAAEHADRIDDGVEAVLPLDGRDVLAHVQRVIHFTFVTDPWLLGRVGQLWREAGSNAWAISPARSRSGNAILVANPHLPWTGVFTWHEAQLVTPQLELYGVTLLGFPFIAIGFNERLAWSHTVNAFDGADLFELELADGGYRFDGQVRSFGEQRHRLRIRTARGALRDEELVVRRSVHGPVIEQEGSRALALRVVGLDQPHMLEQYWRMGVARGLESFERAQAMLQMPMFTTMYADREGHILHLFSGRTPERSGGDAAHWSGIVPGTGSDNLWTETHAYDELPRVLDPPSGWLQNANDPPWTTTFPPAIDAGDYPPYMAPRRMGFRPQRSARMLSEGGESLSFEEVIEAKHSTHMELADRLLDDLEAAVKAHPSPEARAAMDLLAAWDRRTDAGSRGAVLFYTFAGRPGSLDFARPWSESEPRTTPDGLADPKAAVAILVEAARDVAQTYGSADVAWGDVFRLRWRGLDLASNGGPGALGIFRNVGYARDADGSYRARSGDSFVAVVELSQPLRARVLLGYGNASQPGSPHATDQLELFAQQRLRPAWLERSEIEAHLERREVLAP
jgi:acyl-homoserine-lactone acylase